ncbi:MAG: ABC transporter substrate-binding protein [Deltaproteobacteria bacterium]|nr:ABC transporter substrate-binding protein [Deltaproteobacteria bacterium]
MRRKRTILVSAVLVLLAATSIAVSLKGCAEKTDSLETVRIGAARGALSGLVYIAEEKGFFKKHGINAVIETYEAGPMAVADLLTGAVDVATAAEFVMVRKSFDNNSLRTFAQTANTHPIELIGRKTGV